MGIDHSCCKQKDELDSKWDLPKRTFTLTKDNFYEHNHLLKNKNKPFYSKR